MKVFAFSGLNSLLKEEDRKKYLALSEVQNCFSLSSKVLKDDFDLEIDFNRLAMATPQELYSLDSINFVTTLIVCIQVGVSRTLQSRGIKPDFLTSISLGDVARTIVAGSLDFQAAIQISNLNADVKRGLDQYGESIALLVGQNDLAENDFKVFSELELGVSQLSSRLLNISGGHKNIQELRNLSKNRKWRVVHLLNYPFHSEVLRPYSHLMKSFLEKLPISDAQIPLFSSTYVRPIYKSDDIRSEQLLTITHPHHWMRSVHTMTADMGLKTLINIGPCRTLNKATSDIDSTIEIIDAVDLI